MGTPAGSSRKDAEQEQPIGGIDPNAFDAQMLLIDAYIGNLSSAGISTKAGPTVTSDVLQNSTATIDSNIMSKIDSIIHILYDINDTYDNFRILKLSYVFKKILIESYYIMNIYIS